MNRPVIPRPKPPMPPVRSGHGSSAESIPLRPILVRSSQLRQSVPVPPNSFYSQPVPLRSQASIVKTSHHSIGQSGVPNVPAISITQNYIEPQPPPQMPAGYRTSFSRLPLVPPRPSRVSIPQGSNPFTIPVGNGSNRQIPSASGIHRKTTFLDNTDSGTIREQGLLSGVAHQVLPSRSRDFSLPADPSVRHTGAEGPSATRFPRGPSFVGLGSQYQLLQTPSMTNYEPRTRPSMQRPTATQLQMPPPYVPPPIDTYDPTSPQYRYKDELIKIDEMDKIGGRCGFCLEKFALRMKRFLHKICPCFYALFSSKEEEYQLYKAILGFPFGVAVGVLFYYAMIDRLKLSTFFRFMMGTMMLIVMSMGYARSIKIRCIVWLILPCFFGKSGRGILMTMAIGALLTGPVSNTMNNFKESVRTVTCMTELMINMTLVRFELTGKPIFSIVRNFVGSERMDRMTGKLHKSLSPVKSEVENTKETKQEEIKAARMDAEMGTKRSEYFHEQEKKNAAKLAKEDGSNKSKAFAVDTAYIKKLDYRCNNIWGGAVDVCKQGFADAWDNCLRVIPVIGYLICWPTKLDFFCLLVKLFPSPANCDASKLLNSGFGGAYADGDDAATELTQGTKVKLEYMVKPRKGKVDAANIQDVRKGMRNEFGKKQRFFNFIITICQRIMAFAFIQIFITSFQYYNSYVSSIKFDNCYMTDYFRSIERRRRRRGRSTLVPLKKLESRILIEPTAWRLLPPEKQIFGKGTVKLLINSMLFVLIFVFDHLIFAILDIVARHSYVVYTQKGVHDIKLQVQGTGMLAKMVRGILKGFHERHEINQKFDNLKCLPYATLTPPIYYLKVFGTIGLIMVLLYFEAYGLRLRRLVCSFFFPKREKQRILSLYNGTMKRRVGYARAVRHQVRRLGRERHLTMEFDTWTALLNQCPLFCFWLKWVGKGKATCVACREKEDKTFHFCETPGCNFAYCPSCWEDLRRHCYACSPESADEESSLSEGMFGSDDDNPDAKDD